MEYLATQIVSGLVVAIISFAFGYFLFRAQSKEAVRLEVYRRRLDSYEKIIQFLDELDIWIHRHGGAVTEEEALYYARKNDLLRWEVELYVPSPILEVLSEFQIVLWEQVGQNYLTNDLIIPIEEGTAKIQQKISREVTSHLQPQRG